MRARGLAALLVIGAVLLAALFVQHRRASRSGAPAVSAAASSAPRRAGGDAKLTLQPRGAVPLRPPLAAHEAAIGAPSMSGRVLDEDRRGGVAGATLTLLRGERAFSATTGPDGAFRFDDLTPGRYELLGIASPGYAPFHSDGGAGPITLQLDEGTRLRDIIFYLAPERAFEGVVLDSSAKPVSGAAVRDMVAAASPTVTDARGRFRLLCGPHGILEASHPGFAPGRVRCDDSRRIRHAIVIRLRPPRPTGVLAGRVVDGEGRPMSGVEVSAEPTWKGTPNRAKVSPTWRRATSDREGHFLIDELDAGFYDLAAIAEGLAPATEVGVTAGSRDVVLRLSPGARLRGVVRERATQQPTTAFAIVLTPALGALERGPPLVRTFFARDGRFELEALAPGAYWLTAVANGFPPATPQPLPLTAGSPSDVVVELVHGGRVHGAVVSAASGAPIASAHVSFEARLAQSSTPLVEGAVTDERGQFELASVGAGPFTLLVEAPGFHPRLLTGLSLGDRASLGPLTVELVPTAPGELPQLELAGVGAMLEATADALVITGLVPGGGAERAGLRPADELVAVEGVPIVELGFDGAVERIRGPEGTRVSLTLRRGSEISSVEVGRLRTRVAPSQAEP